MQVYLSHPLAERFYVRDVLQPRLEKAGLRIINPFLERPNSEAIFQKGDILSIIKAEAKTATGEEIVEHELALIQAADKLFAYLPYPSVGTVMETYHHSKVLERGKENTLVWTPQTTNVLRYHPWLNTIATVDTNSYNLVQKLHEGTDREKPR